MNKKYSETKRFGNGEKRNHDSSIFYNSNLYNNLDIRVENSSIINEIPSKILNTIINSSSEKMYDIPDNSVHLIITSPPYNVSKEYDNDLSLKEYLVFLKNVFTESYRVLVNGGRICVNIANIGRKPYIPLSDYISNIMIKIGYNMRGEIIWNKAASAAPSTAWGSWQSATNPTLRDIHEYILVFSKGEYKRVIKENEKDIKMNTISKEDFLEWTKSIWTINTESAKRIGHPAPFPEEIPYRLLSLYSFTNDIILDPFMGSGTTAVASIKNNRNYIGYEINKDYIKIANDRLNLLKEQSYLFL
ncbi:DNA-methyltransferase [Brachyspira murdochii]|uniref:DNA-methyltransferase n=1 Tax=Brachyspira murdochii TaxID=84378 RepID=UPI0012F4DE7F|nr:site-specific DNA-methyltransferase [Brachyspira murdochii]